jgi:DNA polymerase-3 subunit alpha
LDLVGGHRAQYLSALDTAFHEASLKQTERETGQGSLFGEALATDSPEAGNGLGHAPVLPGLPPLSQTERLTREKETLGFYISGHPLEPFRAECELFASHSVSQLGSWQEGKMVLGAVVTAIKRQVSKKSGQEFARLTVEDFSGSSELLVFPEAWTALGDRIRADVPLLIKGGYSRRDQGAENPAFVVESVQRFEELRVAGQVAVELDLSETPRDGASEATLSADVIADVRQVLESNPGMAPVEVRWSDAMGGSARLRSRSLKVAANGTALGELRALLGQERVRLVRVGG